MFDETYFMKKAYQQALVAEEQGEVPIGAIVTYKNQILAKAYNQTEALQDATAHAEMLAITAAFNKLGAKYLMDCTLYVTLEPCPMCAGAAHWSKIEKIVYATDDPTRGYTKFSPTLLHPKTTVTKGIMKNECQMLLNDFFEKIRKHRH